VGPCLGLTARHRLEVPRHAAARNHPLISGLRLIVGVVLRYGGGIMQGDALTLLREDSDMACICPYHRRMEASVTANMELLKSIARRAMLERGFLPAFSSAASSQSDAITAPAAATGLNVRDLRSLPWASIDNDDSRDLDQLSVAQPQSGGVVKILVAVADVDALVRRGSPIDDHARTNTTSVYTVPQIFPMLPEKLSTDLTSLAEGQDRLAIVIEMSINVDGAMSASDVYRALVRNQAKLAYNGVGAWLEGRGVRR
jgi:exoribonuclease R